MVKDRMDHLPTAAVAERRRSPVNSAWGKLRAIIHHCSNGASSGGKTARHRFREERKGCWARTSEIANDSVPASKGSIRSHAPGTSVPAEAACWTMGRCNLGVQGT